MFLLGEGGSRNRRCAVMVSSIRLCWPLDVQRALTAIHAKSRDDPLNRLEAGRQHTRVRTFLSTLARDAIAIRHLIVAPPPVPDWRDC